MQKYFYGQINALERVALGRLNKKQNPASGGICCSQLVLVTQTLPKKVGRFALQDFYSYLSSILFGKVILIHPFIASLSKTTCRSIRCSCKNYNRSATILLYFLPPPSISASM
jgi:hypothetical protein